MRVHRSKRFLYGILASYTVLTIQMVVRLFVTPFYLHTLGAALMGLRSFVADFLAYTNLTDLGVTQAIAAIISKESQENTSSGREEETLRKVNSVARLQAILALFTFLFSFVFAIFVEYLAQGLAPEHRSMAQVFIILSGVSLSLMVASKVYGAVLTGKQYMAQNNLYQIINILVNATVGVVLVYHGYLLYGVGIALVASGIIRFIQLRLRVRKTGMRIRLLSGTGSFRDLHSVFRLSIWMLLASLGAALGMQSARIILGAWPELGLEALNLFALLMALPNVINLMFNRVFVNVRPGFIQLVHSGAEFSRINRLALLVLRVSAVLAVTLFSVIYFVNEGFLIRWVGSEFFAGKIENTLMAISMGMNTWSMGFNILVQVRFNFKLRGITIAVEGLITLILTILLIRSYGIIGILTAIIIARSLTILPFMIFNVYKWLIQGGESIHGLAFKTLWLPCLLLGIALMFYQLFPYSPATWLEIIVLFSIVAGINLLAGFLWVRRDISGYLSFLKPRL